MKTNEPLSYLKDYSECRNAAERQAIYLGLGSVGLAALARSPSFNLKLEFVGDGKIHNGYVMVYGPLLILLLAARFFLILRNALEMRSCIIKDQQKVSEGQQQYLRVEQFMLRPPLRTAVYKPAQRRQWSAVVLDFSQILFAPVLAVVSYLLLLSEYFSCELPGYGGSQTWQLMTGVDRITGYAPSWARHPGDMPWIYPPFQTWLYILGGIVLLMMSYWTFVTCSIGYLFIRKNQV
jgi:hypothetical protein